VHRVGDRGEMSDATAEFFDRLAERGHEPLLRKVRGTVRIDVARGNETESRHLTIDRGDLTVTKKRSAAQGVLHVDRAVFDRMASGELNPVAAALRGELTLEGDWRLLVLVQRLFPSSPGARGPRRRAGWAKRRT
jgi:SCP-2 sterol transfer family